MSVTRTPKIQRYAQDCAEPLGQSKGSPQKWPARKTLAIVAVACSFLWGLIIYAANQML